LRKNMSNSMTMTVMFDLSTFFELLRRKIAWSSLRCVHASGSNIRWAACGGVRRGGISGDNGVKRDIEKK
jgi:hypothetical protein